MPQNGDARDKSKTSKRKKGSTASDFVILGSISFSLLVFLKLFLLDSCQFRMAFVIGMLRGRFHTDVQQKLPSPPRTRIQMYMCT